MPDPWDGWEERLTAAAREVLRRAAAVAVKQSIGAQHLFACLARRDQSVASAALALLDLDWGCLGVPRIDLTPEPVWGRAPGPTPQARALLEHAQTEARRLGHHPVNTGHLVLAILAEEAGAPAAGPLTYAAFREATLEVLALPWVHGFALDGEVLLYLTADEALVLYAHLLRRGPLRSAVGPERAVLEDLRDLLRGPCRALLEREPEALFAARLRLQEGRPLSRPESGSGSPPPGSG